MSSKAITQKQVLIPRSPDAAVFAAAESDKDAAVGVVTLGFSTDPIARWVYPNAADHLEHFPSFVRAFAGAAFDAGTAFCTEDNSGAALWLPPGAHPDEEAIISLFKETAREAIHDDFFSLFEQMGASHPEEPHWYLPMIAVDTCQQGRGVGSRLMEYALKRCDEAGLPAYLESSNPRNMSLYARYGFRVTGQLQAGSSPAMFPMVRPAGG